MGGQSEMPWTCLTLRLSPSSVVVTAVITVCVLCELQVTVAQSSEPVSLSVGDFRVVYMEDTTDRRWTVDSAQQYCEDLFNTSLASFHNFTQWNGIRSGIDGARAAPAEGDPSVAYRFGGQWSDNIYPSYGDYSQTHPSPLLTNMDNTQWDFTIPLKFRWDIGKSYPIMARLVRSHQRWTASLSNNQTSAVICNGHSDSEWQSMNPARTTFFECDEQTNDCTLDCVGPPNCAYAEIEAAMQGEQLTIECGTMDCIGIS